MIKDGVDLVMNFEGYSSTPYRCPAGVWTVGYGTTRYPEGHRVRGDDGSCTREQAEGWLLYELQKAECVVVRYIKRYLNANQRAALASFVYNLGSGAFRASTLRRKINTGDWEDVPYQFSRWNKAGGRVMKGLILRRAAEISMWSRRYDLP
jgi:lysozyme